MEHAVDQQCFSKVQSFKLAEDSFFVRQILIEASAAEHEEYRALLTEERAYLAEERFFLGKPFWSQSIDSRYISS